MCIRDRDFCTGMKGVKILYDSFFKEIMSPEYTPGRLNCFLSLLLGKKVVIRQVLPNEGGRIADENTLLVTDILVEFEDGSLADVEIQKLGYAFPGERSACYAADLLLRQYKRARDKRNREKMCIRDRSGTRPDYQKQGYCGGRRYPEIPAGDRGGNV